MTPAANGTDERLDAVLEELRAIRRALEPTAPAAPKAPAKRKRGGGNDITIVDVTNHNDPGPDYEAKCDPANWRSHDDPADVIE